MASSLKSHSPTADIDIWLIDDAILRLRNEHATTKSIFEAISKSVFYRLAIRYSILELSTAVKPYIFKYYMQTEKQEKVVYLDPDLYFCQGIDLIIHNALAEHDYILTPHAFSPLPDDNNHPNDLDLLKSGTFNLGFIAIKNTQSSNALISWWLHHLSENCWANPATGVFTDQKWINLAITYWPNFKSLSESGLNVAYWNLHERELTHANDGYLVNDKLLYFFHFSGFMPHELKLSKHETRIGDLKAGSALYDLANEYKTLLYKFGYNEAIKQKVSIIRFENGASLDQVTAISANLYIDNVLQNGANFNLNEFYAWLTKPHNNIFDNVYINSLLTLRPDVKNHFNSIGKLDAEHLFKWLQDGGAEQSNLDKITLIEIGVYSLPNLCYLGYANAMSGVGDATRANITALQLKRYPTAIEDISSDSIFDREEITEYSNANLHDATITIAHVNADMLPHVYKLKKSLFGKYTIAYMAWETEFFPREWADRSQYCDEIWVPSNFAKTAIEDVIQCPVFVVPHPLFIPLKYLSDINHGASQKKNGPFKFLASFDACSDVERKNPQSVILAFQKAFGREDDVKLIIKVSNADRCGQNLSKLHELVSGQDNIDIISKNLSKDEYFSLMKNIDVYVSLHRGEGFGLNIQQAMAMCKPVIVTNYGGNTDFCLADNSIPIDFKIVPINFKESQYPHYTMWAEPDMQQASHAMRKLYSDTFFYEKIARNASAHILANHSYEKIGNIMQLRLQRISMRLSSYERRTALKFDVPVDEIDRSSPEFTIARIFGGILGRPPSAEDISFYKAIFDGYGMERVFRDILISKEGASRMRIPNIMKTLLGIFWSPSVPR